MPHVDALRLDMSYGRLRGSTIIPPPIGLRDYGPTLQVSIGLHSILAAKLQDQGKQLPDPVTGDAMIDTGATVTCIDTEVARVLSLPQSGKVESCGIGGKASGFTVACTVDIKGLKVGITRAHCHDLAQYSKGLVALIGRDVLSNMILHYNGPSGTISLFLPTPKPPKKKGQGGRKHPPF
ncbi:MAG: retroviral-like aspartic protease family protein [Bacteroidota bacterium]